MDIEGVSYLFAVSARLCEVTDIGADVDPLVRHFSSSELAVLRRARVAEHDAVAYPARLSVMGIVELIAAGIAPDTSRSASPMLSAAAIIAFEAAGLSLEDTDYHERFLDPRVLAEQGVPATMANAFPDDLTEADVIRLHDSGATPDTVSGFGDDWSADDISRLIATGVSPADALPYVDTAFIPADAVAVCVRSGVDASRLDRWIETVGPAVRTSARTLIDMALDDDRLSDPEGFRDALLRTAVGSIDHCDTPEAQKRAATDALMAIVESGGQISTSVPSAWNRQRVLHVGPPLHEHVVLTVQPGEPIRFSYGGIDIDEGLLALQAYSAELK